MSLGQMFHRLAREGSLCSPHDHVHPVLTAFANVVFLDPHMSRD
jgi:hypothetical protein